MHAFEINYIQTEIFLDISRETTIFENIKDKNFNINIKIYIEIMWACSGITRSLSRNWFTDIQHSKNLII